MREMTEHLSLREIDARVEKLEWTAGMCSVKGCPMTMVTYVGAGQWWCWLHMLAHGIHVEVKEP